MALTRARVVTGSSSLCEAIESALITAMNAADPALVRPDAAAMRLRMLRDLPAHGPWDVKLMPGGQIEVEFVVQTGALLTPSARPAQTMRIAIENLAKAGALTHAEAATLTEADRLWRTIQGMLRVTVGPRPPPELPDAALHALLGAIGDCDAGALHARIDRVAAGVRAVFNSRVGSIDERGGR
jgi:glutamate-ammonia-ligase adenylyltransferase